MVPLLNSNVPSLDQQATGLPQVDGAVSFFLQPVSAIIETQQMINGYYKPLCQTVDTQASVQPASKNLEIKTEGERNWQWYVIHILPNVIMRNNDKVTLFGKRYKIMSDNVWQQHGFVSYIAVQDFINA